MIEEKIDLRDYYGIIHKEVSNYPKEFRNELEQAGVVALVQAWRGFDWSRGSRFESYAWPKIHYGIISALRRMTKNGMFIPSTFTDVEAFLGANGYGERMSLEETLGADWSLEDFVQGLADSSVILREVDGLGSRLQRVCVRYLSGLRDHARLKNHELAELLGISSLKVTKSYYDAKQHLKRNERIIELACEKGIIRRKERAD